MSVDVEKPARHELRRTICYEDLCPEEAPGGIQQKNKKAKSKQADTRQILEDSPRIQREEEDLPNDHAEREQRDHAVHDDQASPVLGS